MCCFTNEFEASLAAVELHGEAKKKKKSYHIGSRVSSCRGYWDDMETSYMEAFYPT